MEICTRLGIEHRFAHVCYPQYNGQVEVMNRTIFVGIKKNLLKTGCQWYKELDRVLWSYRTTPSNSTGETPFSLVYGSEVVLPIEVCLPNITQIGYEENKNDDRLGEKRDQVDELRDRALIRIQEHKQEMSRFYNRRVKNRQFKEGDLVLRVLQASQPNNRNKLNPKWEGPYRINRVIGPGTYKLEELSGISLDHTWHGVYLKKYFV
ncbi:hypothetical protein LIER_38336 [Lithospermum erythrorhizon]|uniref:Integrase catalytic domain-containing protein n=1 Tax=Lithospermum erythrorhizon TaxID=34254 RepID=A0AAV3Q1C2_LITER